ncbi:DUF5995 family protein [Kitasatospora sp. DSM 101779]|uniref:DUF5995 family protein n=1 Tax=Kitasatospora sp. DSM 101779 TaxID=2853165 RepID=UPI0021D8F894|nr:DUF5995 family protein [Kitasatospora sp. DSM 101779]MCU7820316.1 hypothetical protein [Kitasatospora sp. DSM 101779]
MTIDTRPAADQVARVADLLEQRVNRYDAVRDHRAVFAYLYLRLTRALEQGLRDGRPAFVDPEWIAELSRRLAMTYLTTMDAIDAWQARPRASHRRTAVGPDDLPDTIARPWREVFAAASIRRSYVLEEIVFSMVAHMSYDLPLALRDLAAAGSGDAHDHIGDFQRMNTLLGTNIREVQTDVAKRYCRQLLFLEHLFIRDELLLTDGGIRMLRADAWFNFDRLIQSSAAADAQRTIGRITEDVIREFRHPGDPKLRILYGLLRRLVPARREWPPATPDTG